MAHCLRCPSRRFICVAGGARVGDFVLIRHLRGNETEAVRVNKRVRRALGFDRWHVTGYALASCGTALVMGVLFNRRGARPIRRKRAVTV